MAFAKQKLDEVALLAQAIQGVDKIQDSLAENRKLVESRKTSPRIHRPEVAAALAGIDASMASRKAPYLARREQQIAALSLPALPTTTIGSFPQTAEVRKMRAAFRTGKIDSQTYEKFLEEETERCIRFQESVGLDVLVHGEFERNDMVEYFGEQLDGFVFSENGWVQSYGSRCVKPPIIFGDVSRPHPMTVRWSSYAQSLTDRPVKGMLTGPVTILQWSFVRDDQPRSQTCNQIALAIREEVADLEAAGIRIIQSTSPPSAKVCLCAAPTGPPICSGASTPFVSPLRSTRRNPDPHPHVLFRVQRHHRLHRRDGRRCPLHRVSRSRMELLGVFDRVRYPNEIGPGVYDIHSPRVPENTEIEHLLHKALEVLTPQQLWINPDCGLKTRGWPEVSSALTNMVETATKLRSSLPPRDRQE